MTNSDAIKIELSFREKFVIDFANTYANDVSYGEMMIRENRPLRVVLIDAYNWLVENRGMPKYQPIDEEKEKGLQVCICLWLLNFVFEKYFV